MSWRSGRGLLPHANRRAITGSMCAGMAVATMLTAGLLAGTPVGAAETLSADEIMAKVESADEARRGSMRGHTSIREYVVENARFGMKAAMKVEATVDSSGGKRFRVIEMTGPAPVRKLVFARILKTETDASGKGAQGATRITRANYAFRLVEKTAVNGREAYALDAEPRSENPLLLRGRIWVDAEAWAVVKIEGEPAKSPSFWVKKTHFVHEYVPVGEQWLAAMNRSESEIRMFGKSVVTVKYGEYRVEGTSSVGGK